MSTISPKNYAPCAAHNVAFLGLGTMGLPMAGHLARAGHHVTVFNRTAAKAQAWAAEFNGKSAATPREAAAGASIVFACVGNDDDLRKVALGDPRGHFGVKQDAQALDKFEQVGVTEHVVRHARPRNGTGEAADEAEQRKVEG
ncbi:MAG: NAD(P)-dependent oxidoreductase, partial [Aquincola sp.]|nr:NAD(P)-dependent oxidoreductase [Aquincola sp.]